jgi:hypothetical protein
MKIFLKSAHFWLFGRCPFFKNRPHSTAPGVADDVFCRKNVSYLYYIPSGLDSKKFRIGPFWAIWQKQGV